MRQNGKGRSLPEKRGDRRAASSNGPRNVVSAATSERYGNRHRRATLALHLSLNCFYWGPRSRNGFWLEVANG